MMRAAIQGAVRAAALMCLLTLALAPRAWAQAGFPDVATLIADRVGVVAGNRVIAEGNVEVLYQGIRMRASRVIYDGAADRVSIDGPITLVEGEDRIVLADSAALDADFRNGLLRGARLVLDQQLQLAAAEINRVDGRFTQLYKTVASSCQVCGTDVPLWRIRATRVTHDQEERQLYFENARLEVAGVPVFWVPQMRLPDPTLDRSTGFLIPEVRSNSLLGLGLKVPYFVTLGRHADLTFTPYLARSTRTLEGRYRQALSFGDLEFEGAVSDDALTTLNKRGYLFGFARFDLPRDFVLRFDVELVSDPAYLLDYGYSDKDRLANSISLERVYRDEYFRTSLSHYRTLRDRELAIADQLPSLTANAIYERRFREPVFGGQAGIQFEGHSHRRDSTVPGLGRDVIRGSARLDWRRSEIIGPGIVFTGLGEFNLDIYHVYQSTAFANTITSASPFIGAELRWPFTKAEPGGAVQTLTPIAQVIWSEDAGASVPNEDSVWTEFDEGNLFSFNRFPGSDLYERGLRANIGATWSRLDPRGREYTLTFGRIFRATDLNQFAPGSGLEGTVSDWLVAAQVKHDALTFTNRAVFDDNLDFSGNELRLAYASDRLDLASTYFWSEGVAPLLAGGGAGARQARASELTVDASYDFTRNWTGSAKWRYDFGQDNLASAGIGVAYRNECVDVGLSVSRRFTSSTTVQPSTDFGLTVRLTGFGSGGGGTPRRSCGG